MDAVITQVLNQLIRIYIEISGAAGSFIYTATKTKYTDWAPYLTDIIAVSAALGALALPISLSVIETTRSRYKSPTLLKIYTEISKTDPQKLNRELFSTLAFTLIIKLFLLLNIIDAKHLVLIAIPLTLIFTSTISKLYQHLKFTYKIMADISGIKNELIEIVIQSTENTNTGYKKSLFKRKKTIPPEIISTLIEIETYELCTDHGKRDIDEEFKKAIYKELRKIPDEGSILFIEQVLSALPRMMAEVETARESDIYQTIAGLYVYIIPKALIKSDQFSSYLSEVIRISRVRERDLPPHAQFCGNGRVFLNCMLEYPNNKTYKILFDHFNELLSNALYKAPGNIPQILSSANSLLFGAERDKNSIQWEFSYRLNILWEYEGNQEIARKIKLAQQKILSPEELEHELTKIQKPKIIKFLESKDSKPNSLTESIATIDKATKTVLRSLAAAEFSDAVEIKTLQSLGTLLETSPETIIKCREEINPAGSSVTNIGRPLVPSSIASCIKAFTLEKYYTGNGSITEVLEFRIIDAIATLLIYELWKDLIFHAPQEKLTDINRKIILPDCTIYDLKSALKRTELLNKSFAKILNNEKISEKLNLLKDHKDTLRIACDLLTAELYKKLDFELGIKIKTQTLDTATTIRFKKEIIESISGEIKRLPLMKRYKVSPCTPQLFSLEQDRECFLADTGIHYDFSQLGFFTLSNLYNSFIVKILNHHKISCTNGLPTPFGENIIITPRAFDTLLNSGFEITNNELTWPGGNYKMPYHIAQTDSDYYFQTYKTEHYLCVDFENSTQGYPVTIFFSDDGNKITQNIQYNFSLAAPYKN